MLQITVGRVVDRIERSNAKKGNLIMFLFISCPQIFQVNNEISCRVADCCFSEFVCLENSRKSKCHKTSNKRPGNSVIKDLETMIHNIYWYHRLSLQIFSMQRKHFPLCHVDVCFIEVPFCGTVKSPKCVTFAPAKHNVKNSVPRTFRWINWNFDFKKPTSQVKSS